MFLQRAAALRLRSMPRMRSQIGLLQALQQLERNQVHLPRPILHAAVIRQASFSSRLLSTSRRAFSSAAAASPSYDQQQQQQQHPPPPPPPPRSRFRRFASLVVRGLFFSTLGYMLVLSHATRPLWKDLDVASMFPTDAAAMKTAAKTSCPHAAERDYRPATPEAEALEAYLADHPMVRELRSAAGRAQFPDEQRPTLRMPPFMRRHNLTASTLVGPDMLAIPPLQWTDGRGRELKQVWHLGSGLCGHPGIVHGGFVATMLDEALARCCFAALPLRVGMTAYLNIDYRAPTPAGAFVVLHAKTVRVEGRKAWVQARLETLPPLAENGKPVGEPVVLAEAEALFVGFRDYGLGKYVPSINT